MTEPLGVDSPFQADVRTFLGIFLSFVIGAVATAAGVGGGAIYIPLFNALVGFALKPSTALSQACITASSLAALTTNLPRTHPSMTEAPMIDFPLMLMLTPMLLVGVGIGVLLNVALPSWLLNILLLVLLMLLVSQAVAKGRALWVQETKRAQAAAEAAAYHDIDAELLSANARAADLANANGTGIREALLLGGHHCTLGHQALTGAAPAGLPGLRIHHGHSYSCPRVPWGLEHDQDATYNYPESLENHAAVAISRDQVRRSRGVSGGGSSVGAARQRTDDAMWDCMEGVNPAGDDDARCETPSSGVSMPPSAFPFAIPRVPSSNGADEVSGAGHLRSGLLGASPRGQSPASSIYAASWKAFNELVRY
ncbi:hypothetical protein Vafri_12661 [Volvox africanus]|uniref:Uncharacterized protein n=1 Tax=Volvox africanus TaxID=51714 RepID=A0A8J4F4P7_9CHLO|nr:hypothetical protein Vafri_12661 [Volvox africanus]